MSFLGQGYPKLPSPSGSTGQEAISEGTDQDATGSIWTGSTTSSPRGSLGRSEGSCQVGKQRVSLVEIISQITRRTKSALVIPQGDLVAALGQSEGNFGSVDGDRSWSELPLAFGVDSSFVRQGRRDMDGSFDSGQGGESSVGTGKSQ